MNKAAVRKLVGKQIVAVHKRGGTITGKLVKISGHTLYIEPNRNSKGKKVTTKAIIPLVLFDLLAIGSSPYGYGYPYGGYPYGGYPYGGYPKYYW